MKDYYKILEIPENSPAEDIHKAYRRLAKKYHPDVNKSANAHELFIEISEAYEYLIKNYQKTTYKETVDFNDIRNSEEYERFRQEVKDRAQKQAKMRYEEFKKQHEAFQKSGINDFIILVTFFARVLIVPLTVILTFLPLYLAFFKTLPLILMGLITWPFAYFLAWYIRDNRKKLFKLENLYYNPHYIKKLFTETHVANQSCFYSYQAEANSIPYKIELLKLKDIKLNSRGYRQHNVNYINESFNIYVPRSQKAFIVHSFTIAIKVISVLSFSFFFPISSIIWRIIAGMLFGGLLSSVFHLFSLTRSNVTFLYNYGTLIRVLVWLLLLSKISHFSLQPFNIYTNEYVHFVVISIIIFDCFLMQLVNLILGKWANKTLSKQYTEVENHLKSGFKLYNDITIISFVYPVYKWIFG